MAKNIKESYINWHFIFDFGCPCVILYM